MVHPIARPRRRRLLTIGALLAVVLTGCAGAPEPEAAVTTPSQVVRECEAEWKELAADWELRAEGSFPSDLAPRWTALAAGAIYQSTAVDEDCRDDIEDAELTAAAIEELTETLRPYDLVWQFGEVHEMATAWIAQADRRPARRAQRALDRLERLSSEAVADMDAVWQQAVRADLDDPEAMRELTESMAFVAGDSAPYRQGSAALDQLSRLLSRP